VRGAPGGTAPLAIGTAVESEAGPAGEITSSCPVEDASATFALARINTKALEGGPLLAAGRRLELLIPPAG